MVIPEKLYQKIIEVMPVPCVDLLVTDKLGKVLLLKRKNEPAKGQWWFPGGRVHFLETRVQAASRKLKEECGLEALQMKEVGTYDVILDMPDDASQSHGITTLFHISVRQQSDIILDTQSLASDWRMPDEWLSDSLHFFIKQAITILLKKLDANEVLQN